MSRKRKSDQEPTTEANTAVVETPAADTATGVVQPLAPESNGEGQSFADRVGQKKWQAAPDPFGLASDNVAGVRLFESRQDRQMAIKFGDGSLETKPSQAVIDRMKEAGYRWSPRDRVWTYPLTSESAMATRIDAEKLYQGVRQMIREEKGVEPTQDIAF